jgi:secreted trypsin-like serine protease
MYRFQSLLVFLFTPILASGCFSNEEVISPSGQSRPIIGGVEATELRHNAVVSLHAKYVNSSNFSDQIFCSGTLVAADVVLTAAHCLDVASGGPNFKTRSPADLAIYFGDAPEADPDFQLNRVLVAETLIHPSYDRRRLLNDAALVRLEEGGSGTVVPVPALPLTSGLGPADVGTMVDFAGFGYSNVEKTDIGVKLHAEAPIAALGCPEAVCGPSINGPEATQFSYFQDPEGPCNGDSGGPAFLDRDPDPLSELWYVAGITSYGDSGCSEYGASTRVDAFEGWIGDFVAGTEPPPPVDCSADDWCNPDCAEGEDPDCGIASCTADGWCDPECAEGEDPDCAITCEPTGEEVCTDGVDNDCDGTIDKGCLCTSDNECSSGKCKGKPGAKTCK